MSDSCTEFVHIKPTDLENTRGSTVAVPRAGRSALRPDKNAVLCRFAVRESCMFRPILRVAFLSSISIITGCGGAGSVGMNPPGVTTAASSTMPRALAADVRRLVVTNSVANTVTDYGLSANGDVRPLRTIAGTNTQLSTPIDYIHDATSAYVSNFQSNSITVYPANATGNVKPIRVIKGPATGLSGPSGIALDAAGNLIVLNDNINTITVYKPNANGNARPIKTIAGPTTGLDTPSNVVVINRDIYVTNEGAHTVTVYAPNATGDAQPLRTIGGPATKIASPVGIAAAGHSFLVSDATTQAIMMFPANANGNVAPQATYSGPASRLANPVSLFIDGTNNRLWVANYVNSTITSYAWPANPHSFRPVAIIAGPKTGLSGPGSVTI